MLQAGLFLFTRLRRFPVRLKAGESKKFVAAKARKLVESRRHRLFSAIVEAARKAGATEGLACCFAKYLKTPGKLERLHRTMKEVVNLDLYERPLAAFAGH